MKKCDLVGDINVARRYAVCVVHGRRSPFHTLGQLMKYMSTKFSENVLIETEVCTQNEIRIGQNSTSSFNFDECHFLRTFLFMIVHNFKKITERAAELCAIQLFLYPSLNLHCQRHNNTVPSCRSPILFSVGFSSALSVCDFSQRTVFETCKVRVLWGC